ncbi:MAG: ATP-binding cassette domain-containing protein, partial [Myxococcales bacterium]|nr:ATP-binding cassette domain-containing protein [Myxococcales bacterium]
MRVVHSPMVLQMEAAECGAAALGIVLAHHGRWVPLSELRARCGVSRDGSRASSVVKVARSYGLEAQGYKKSIEALRELEPPFVVFWQFNHFLVVDGFEGGHVLLNDPAHGHRRLPLEEFDRDFTGVTLVMRPGPDFQRGGAAPSVVAGLARRLRSVAQPLVYVGVAALLLTLTGLGAAAFLQIYVDDVLVGRQRGWVAPLLVAMGVLLGQQLVLVGLRDLVLRRVRLALAAGSSRTFVEHLLRLPLLVHAQRHVGDLASRVALNDTLAEVMGGHLALAAVDSMMLALVFVVMLAYDPCLTVFSVLGAGAVVLGVRSFTRRRTEAEARHLQAQARERSVAVSGLRDLETIKASGLEDDLFVTWSEEFLASVGTSQELSLSAARLGMLARLLAATNALLVLVVGGLRVVDGALSIGVLMGYQVLVAAFHAPLLRLMGRAADLQALRGDTARLDDLLEQAADRREESEGEGEITGHLKISGARFAFDGVHGDLLSDVDLEVRAGTRTALVGASGSGKSTLLRLVAGLLPQREGEILLDG